jgi:hypothetical protein
MTRSWFWGVLAAVPILGLLLLFAYRDRTESTCRACHSRLQTSQWRIRV